MHDNFSNDQLNRNITVFTLIVTGTLGVMAFQVLPSLVIGMLSDLGFDQKQIGNVSTWQLLGIAVGSFINLRLVKVISWRRIAYTGVVCLLLTDLASMFIRDYTAFILVRFISGTAGGICVSFAAFALGNTRWVDRNYGLFLSFQVGFAIVANLFLPGIVQTHGIISIFVLFTALESVAVLILLRNIPDIEVTQQGASGVNSAEVWTYCIIQLTAILFFFVALGGFWTYIAPIALDAGLSEQQTGRALSAGLFGGLAGAFVAAQMNIRFGRLIPILFAVGLQFSALVILYSGFDFPVFVLAAGMFMFGWYMFYPYQLGLLAALDKDGRPMILSNAVAGTGSGFGPFIVSIYLHDDFLPAYVIAGIFLFLALLLTVVLVLISKRELKAG